MPYGLTAGYDVRVADVGVDFRKAWREIQEEGYLIGSPSLVVQVKSPFNHDRKMVRRPHHSHYAWCGGLAGQAGTPRDRSRNYFITDGLWIGRAESSCQPRSRWLFLSARSFLN